MTNTKNNLIAKRYSDALLSLVQEWNRNIADINLQLKSISDDIKSSADLTVFMENPVISAEDKKEVMTKLLNGKVDEVLVNFIKLLIDKDRFSALEEISEIFDSMVAEINNVKKVNVVSAIELNEGLRGRLVEKLSSKLNKKVELVTEVNPEIIAGLIIKIDDNVIDMSLRNKFEEMKKQMIK